MKYPIPEDFVQKIISDKDKEYRDRMDFPMELLTGAMWEPNEGPQGLLDHEIVVRAAEKIKMLREMLQATGMSEGLIKAVMK